MAGEIKVNILTGFQDKGVKDAIDKLKGLGAGFKNMAKQLVGAYLGFQGFQKGVQFIRNSIDASRDLQRNIAGLQTVFGPATKEMLLFAKAGVSMGMSTAEAAKGSTLMGTMLKAAGFSLKDNTKLTQKLVKLSADLAATFGYDVSEALVGMTAMFRGEYDPIEKFGVAIKQAQVNAEMARLGLNKLTGQEKLHAQQLIKIKLLMAATADVQGAFIRQSDTLAVAQQKLAATTTNMQAALGQNLIEPVTQLVVLLQSLTVSVGPSLTALFISMGEMFGLLGNNATGAASQISALIDQITGLVDFAAPILQFLVGVMSSLGSSIIVGVIAFKVMRSVVNGVGTAMTAVATIIDFVRIKMAAATAATNADTVAKEANIVATRTLSAAMMATPWGALAVGIGLIAGGLLAMNAATEPVNRVTGSFEELQTELMLAESEFDQMNGNFNDVNYYPLQKKIAQIKTELDLLNLSAGRASDALDIYKNTNGIDNKTKKEKKKEPPVVLDAAALAKIKAAAIAAAKPFKDMVKSIEDNLRQVHDSIMATFDITNMGTNGGSISRNIEKFMIKLREFAGYIKTLQGMKLNGNLLQQLSMAGPEAGLAAAKAFASDPGLVAQANAAYGELGMTSNAIAGSVMAAKAAPVYNITVSAGVGDKKTIGQAVVEAIKSFEKSNGSGWRK